MRITDLVKDYDTFINNDLLVTNFPYRVAYKGINDRLCHMFTGYYNYAEINAFTKVHRLVFEDVYTGFIYKVEASHILGIEPTKKVILKD